MLAKGTDEDAAPQQEDGDPESAAGALNGRTLPIALPLGRRRSEVAENRRLSAETYCCVLSFRMFCGAAQRRLPNHLLGGADGAGECDGLVIAAAV